MPSTDLDALEEIRRTLSDTIARMRPAGPLEVELKDELVAKRDAIATEQDRLLVAKFEGSTLGLDKASAELQVAIKGLKGAVDRIASTKKVLDVAGSVLALAAKAAAKLT